MSEVVTGADVTGADVTGADVTGADVTGAAALSDDDEDEVDESLHSPGSGEEVRRVGDGLAERLSDTYKSAARRADRRVGDVDADDDELDGSSRIGDVDVGGAAGE